MLKRRIVKGIYTRTPHIKNKNCNGEPPSKAATPPGPCIKNEMESRRHRPPAPRIDKASRSVCVFQRKGFLKVAFDV